MKRYISVLFILCVFVIPFFSASYTNNQYQQAARRYSVMAEKAFDDGEYDLASEYAAEAAKNAELSRAYIEKMLARADAEKQMNAARTRLRWAANVHGERNFPSAYATAKQAIDDGTAAWTKEDYPATKQFAIKALDALSVVKEITPLPQFYVVRPWGESGDCYWNIAGRPWVYNSPLLWEHLYSENRGIMRKPDNPNLIFPGMILKIPSIAGEYREGMYNPSITYEAFTPQK